MSIVDRMKSLGSALVEGLAHSTGGVDGYWDWCPIESEDVDRDMRLGTGGADAVDDYGDRRHPDHASAAGTRRMPGALAEAARW